MRFERMPRQERGHDTRSALIRSARQVFEERGYVEARVADITAVTGAGHGTFYHYFSSKKDVFRAVAAEVRDELLGAQGASYLASDDPRASIRLAVASYVDAYRVAARIIALVEQMATYDEEIRELRLEVRRALARRTQRAIEAMAAAGQLEGPLDAEYLTLAIGSMVDRVAYVWLVLGEQLDPERTIEALTDVYTRAIRLCPRPAPTGGGA